MVCIAGVLKLGLGSIDLVEAGRAAFISFAFRGYQKATHSGRILKHNLVGPINVGYLQKEDRGCSENCQFVCNGSRPLY